MIPMNSQGSAVIENAKGFNQTMEVGICTGVYNVQTGTCNPPCTNCNGVTSLLVTANSANILVGGTTQLTATVYYSNGSNGPAYGASWTSSPTSVATVSNAGLATGVAEGSASIMASLQNQDAGGRFCNCTGCPIRNFEGSATVTVWQPYQVNVVGNISSGANSCGTGSAGRSRWVYLQLQDRYGAGIPIANIQMADSFGWGTRNDLGLNKPQNGADGTDGTGSWQDHYFFCSSVCPGNTGESDLVQYWTANGVNVPLPSALVFKCSSISVNGNAQ
jgi:hypothetical protein